MEKSHIKNIIKIVIFISIFFCFNIFYINISNAVEKYYIETTGGEVSSNVGNNNYISRAELIDSYLQENSDGTISRIEYVNDKVTVETYNSSFKLKSKKTLENELLMFGGFYSGEKYNFLVFGQNNLEEDDNVEVCRVVKYSKNWERLESVSIKGANTIGMFSSGCCRMTELNGSLWINTAHSMYKTNDGVSHQSNMLIKINQENMIVEYCRDFIAAINFGYVSHSFNQFIETDGEYIYTVDHGDTYPRAVTLCKIRPDQLSTDGISYALEIAGKPGNTGTGVSVGEMELSNNNCLIVGNSIPQEEPQDYSHARNIFLAVTPKDDVTTTSTKLKWITNYTDDKNAREVRTPHLLKINDNKFLIIWEEARNDEYGKIKMLLIDSEGNSISDIITVGGRLSDCKPIVYNNKVTWYITVKESTPIFFSIDVSSTSKFNEYNNQNLIDFSPFSNFDIYSYDDGEVGLNNYDNKIEDLVLPNITYPWVKLRLGERVFENCDNLKNIVLPEGITEIPYQAFFGCVNLQTIKIPSTVKTIKQNAFLGAGMTEIVVPDAVETIERAAFRNCNNLKTITLPKNLTEIADYLFFASLKLENVTIPEKVVTIGLDAFANTGIKKIEIPSSVKTIKAGAFSNCEYLEGTIVIPESVTTIENRICEYSDQIKRLIIENKNAEIGTSILIHNVMLKRGETFKAIEGANIGRATSSNEKIATVKSDGTITAEADGSATITYYNSDDKYLGRTFLTVVKPVSELPFYDVSIDDWYYDCINYCYKNKIFYGTSDTLFSPEQDLTRGMLVTTLWRMDGAPEVSGNMKFTDVSSKMYYYEAIKWALSNKIVSGYTGTTEFRPENKITREDLSIMLRNYSIYKGKYKEANIDLNTYIDGNQVSSWAKTAMQWAVANKVVTGDQNKLTPKDNATRAEVASMLFKYCSYIK